MRTLKSNFSYPITFEAQAKGFKVNDKVGSNNSPCDRIVIDARFLDGSVRTVTFDLRQN